MKRLIIFLFVIFSIVPCAICSPPIVSGNLPAYDSLVKEIGPDSILYHEVEKYEKQGFENRTVLFAGSSTFAGWKSLESTFEKYGAVKRAIGGMVLSQVIWHSEVLIFKNNPEVLVFYIGDNDASRYDYPTFERYMISFVANFVYRQSESKLILVSVKPSPSRENNFEYYRKVNGCLRAVAAVNENVSFVDIWTPMSLSGEVRSYFQEDMLHLNEKGNEVIVSLLTPLLDKFHKYK